MEHTFERSWEFKGRTVIECKSCGYKHLHPKPTKEELDDFYVNQYHAQIKGFDYSAVDEKYIAEAEKNVIANRGYINIFETASKFKKSNGLTMLDIGCGNNLCSVFFKQMGWDSYVIEPNKDSFKYISNFGINGYNCFFEEMDKCDLPKFSFINLQFVLEHILNPLEVFEKASDLLAQGGVIRVVTPNDFSEAHLAYMEYFQKQGSWICYPDHINYFNFETLEKLITEKGYEVVFKTTNFPLEMLLLSGIDYYHDKDAKSKVSEIVRNFNNSFIKTGGSKVLDNFYEKIANAGFGRSADIYAIKK